MIETQQLPEGVPVSNCIFDCHLPHAEILDMSTGQAWHSLDPISKEEYEAMNVPEGFRKVGIGTAATDLHYFRRPPNADEDGPLTERQIDGRRFVQNANAPSQPPTLLGEKYPLMILANKYHSLVYNAGRKVRIVTNPDGVEYVELIAPSPDGGSLFQGLEPLDDPEDLGLPPDWKIRDQEIIEQTVIHLPYPTEALFFANGASFQGPINAFR